MFFHPAGPCLLCGSPLPGGMWRCGVNPGQTLHLHGSGHQPQSHVSRQCLCAAHMVDAGIATGLFADPGRARLALGCIANKSSFQISSVTDAGGQAGSVFQGHGCTLCKMGQGRVSCIACQHAIAPAPCGERVKVGTGPGEPARRSGQQIAQRHCWRRATQQAPRRDWLCCSSPPGRRVGRRRPRH